MESDPDTGNLTVFTVPFGRSKMGDTVGATRLRQALDRIAFAAIPF
jgi:hypothetical protein